MSDNSKLAKMPVLAADGENYEGWRKDVKLWCLISKGTDKEKAIMLYLSLTGRPKLVSEEVRETLLGGEIIEKPVDKILEKLDTVFLPEKGMRQFNAFNKLYCL